MQMRFEKVFGKFEKDKKTDYYIKYIICDETIRKDPSIKLDMFFGSILVILFTEININ